MPRNGEYTTNGYWLLVIIKGVSSAWCFGNNVLSVLLSSGRYIDIPLSRLFESSELTDGYQYGWQIWVMAQAGNTSCSSFQRYPQHIWQVVDISYI